MVLKGAEKLSYITKQYRKILLVHGHSYEQCRIKELLDPAPHVDFTDFSPNPLYEDAVKGVELFNRERCDAIVAVGGGSAIDVAKCIKLFCQMDSGRNYLFQDRTDTGVHLVAVPTTAGTGSESTRHAVLYYKGQKQSISHDSILPDYAVLIPELLESLSPYQKKCTMLDALCQAVESWWSVHSTEESIGYSKKAIVGIRDQWQVYLGGDLDAAGIILEAANFSGKAINLTATTAAHAMSYGLTSLYGLPHGHAVAVCLPEVWDYMRSHIQDCSDIRGAEYLNSTFGEIEGMISSSWYRRLLDTLDIRCPVSASREADIKSLTCSVNPLRLKNSPIALTAGILQGMYGRIVRSEKQENQGYGQESPDHSDM